MFDLLATARCGSRLESAYFVVARRRKSASAHSSYITQLRSLGLVLASRCLPHSLQTEKRVCSLARLRHSGAPPADPLSDLLAYLLASARSDVRWVAVLVKLPAPQGSQTAV